MTWQRIFQIFQGLGPAALLLVAACGGAQAPPSEYGYGDMFEEDSASTSAITSDSEGYGGDGAAAYDAPSDDEYMAEEEIQEMALEPPPEPTARMSFGGGGRRRAERRAQRAAMEEPPPPPSPGLAAPSQPEAQSMPAPEPVSVTGETTPSTTEPAAGPESGRPPAPTAEGERAGPLMIYEATLGLAVHDVEERIDETVRITHEIGGHVQSQTNTSVIVRVPAPRFREALGLFEALGDVVQRRITAQDVSEQVRDIQIRLRNAMQMRDRLAQLLEQAQTVPESLAIEHELERLNETIALMEGQLEALEDRIAFSTITVNFSAIQQLQEIPNQMFRLPFSWLDELGLQYLLQL